MGGRTGSGVTELVVPNPWHGAGSPTVAELDRADVIVGDTRIPVGIVTELARNPGLSITNNAEGVVAAVRALLGSDALVIEHYGPRSYVGGTAGRRPDTFDQVDLADGSAVWRWLGGELLEALARLAELAAGAPQEGHEWR